MIHISNGVFSYGIGDAGENLYFRDERDGRNYLAENASVCSYLTTCDGAEVPAVSATVTDNGYTVTYADGNVAEIGVTMREDYAILTLLSVKCADFLKIAFVNIPVDIDYHSYILSGDGNGFTATLMGLTLATRMAEHPGRNLILRAEGYPKIGLSGTRGHTDRPVRVAIFGAKDGNTRDIMKCVMDEIPDGELPKNKKGGPYALDVEDGKETYITIGSDIRKEDMPEVLRKLRHLGVTQVSFHQGGGYRQGDFALLPSIYPNGDEDLHEVMRQFHEAGIGVMMHCYTFFTDHYSRYLTPVPHEDLDAICRLTLAGDLTPDATEIRIVEPPDDVAEVYDYSLVSSPYLKIDKELVRFGSVRHEPPYAFINCERGALGTRISSHTAGAEVRQLKEYFAYVLPKADSPLFYEIAANTAAFYNKFGFDGFYMDAIDGVFAMEGNEYAWYYAMEFITEVLTRLDHDPVFDCCYNPQYTGSFYARSRYGALDHGSRAFRQYVDAHMYYDETTAERMFLPPELGWFDYFSGTFTPGWQSRLMREEDVAYLWNRVIGADACFALNAGEFGTLGQNPLVERALAFSHRYDTARQKLSLTADEKAALRRPGSEFALRDPDGKPYFVPAKTLNLSFDGNRNALTAENPFKAQRPVVRLFLLTGAENGDGDAVILPGIPDTTLPCHAVFPVGGIDAGTHTAIRFRVYGDGSGAVLRLRLARDLEGIPQAQGDYFVKADFTGWREFAFYETRNENDPFGVFPPLRLRYKVFSDVSEFYAAYRNGTQFGNICTVVTDIMGEYRDIRIDGLRCVRPRTLTYENPGFQIGDTVFRFDATLTSGNAIECDEKGHATVVDPIGNILCDLGCVTLPELSRGKNDVRVIYGCDDADRAADLVFYVTGDGNTKA